jgi:flagellin-specific chaperone FliS
MGFVQAKLNNSEGMSKMISALDARLKKSDTGDIYSSYNHLYEYYLDNNNNNNREQVLQFVNKGSTIA